MTKVLYPGSFDPITKGHMNVIKQASELFDEVIVAVMKNPSKKEGFFTISERVDLIEKLYENNEKIKVITASGAVVDVAALNNCKAMIRGLRGVTDFDYEIQLAVVNKKINDKINTICLFPDNGYQYISSSVVKEVFNLEQNIDGYVEEIVRDAMVEKQKTHVKRR